jgi:hypothetical protein
MPVLLISGVVNNTVLARAAEVQSNDVMFKPFAAEQLIRKIDALLAGVPGDAEPGTDLKTRLTALAGASGVRFVALADREGFLIESAGDTVAEIDVAAALAACLGESSEGIGRELGQGSLQGMILEYESATLLLHGVGPDALLAVLVADSAALGKIRYLVKRALPGIQQEL